jgi:uncharacterized protein (TIGR02599 family)
MHYSRANRVFSKAFTLVELLVSITVLSVLMLVIMQLLDSTQSTVVKQQSRAEEFKDARAALENISRSLSNAVINSYWAYGDSSVAGKVNFTRQSDGHFISGPATVLLGPPHAAPGHGFFFQAADGHVRLPGSTSSLGDPYNLIVCAGYYVDFNSDLDARPDFLAARTEVNPERQRFRLMQLRVPPNENLLYSSTLNLNKAVTREGVLRWLRGPFPASGATWQEHSVVLADNILALIAVPRYIAVEMGALSESTSTGKENSTTTTKPVEDYYYDSREYQWGDKNEKSRASHHQLPPVVELTLVAVEERSYEALSERMGSDALRQKINDVFADLFVQHSKFKEDMEKLEAGLTELKLHHRVFSTSVLLRGSKWIIEERKS